MADRYNPIEGCRGGSNPIIGSSGTYPCPEWDRQFTWSRRRRKSSAEFSAVALAIVTTTRLHQAVNELGILGVAGLDPYGLKAQLGLPLPMARRLVGILELARRLTVSRRPDTALLKTPESVRELMAPALVHLAHEQFWCLPVNARNSPHR